jgi:plastocyanin
MSILGRTIPGKVVAAVAALMIVGALLPVMTTSRVDREVTLVANGMAFYLEGDDKPNPTITVRAGERVRVVFKNQDRGMTHDFAVPALGEAMSLVGWNETDDLTIRVPSTPGTYEYICNPHRLMMRGTIKVTD